MGAQAGGGAGAAAPPPAPWDAAGGGLDVARAAAAAARSVPGVAALSPGRFAAAATYGPGGVVHGVAVRRWAGGVAVEVHLSAAYAPALDLPALAERVRRAVAAALRAAGTGPRRQIDVVVDDLQFGPRRARRTGAAGPRAAAAGPAGPSG
jgi:hypothetical protein